MDKRYAAKLLKAAEKEVRMAISEEDRYMGSVFVNPFGQRQHEERIKRAWEHYHRLGGNKDI
jgi:hypothetical protein